MTTGGAQQSSLAGVPGVGDIPGVVLDALDISAKVTVINHTNETLSLIDQSGDENDADNGRPSTGQFVTLPLPDIAPGGKDDFEYGVANVRVTALEVHTDAQGFVTYQVGNTGKTYKLIFTNPLVGGAHGEATLTSPGDGFTAPPPQHGSGKHAPIQAVLRQDGFDPNHPGTPEAVTSRSIVTVTNNTELVLTLADQGHERGGFLSFPKPALQPGETDSFASVETQGVTDPKLQGEKGFLLYQIGENASGGFWRLDWENPEHSQNTSSAIVQNNPEGVVYQSLDQIGEGEDNVPVTFTLSGGGGGVGPDPDGAEWAPPVESSGEPTLRPGDNDADGWVEYMQQLLNHHAGTTIVAEDGNFDPDTHAAVLHLQQQYNVLEDGVVGNQTWAVLRGEPAAPAGTDGRAPHTFEETGPQARWFEEGTGGTMYDPSTDVLTLFLASTGEQRIDDFEATVRVTGNDAGELFTVQAPLGPPVAEHPGGGGNYTIEFSGLHESYGDGVHTVEAYLPAELGGDYTTFQIRCGNV